jgi:two-component system cell cycle response regulator
MTLRILSVDDSGMVRKAVRRAFTPFACDVVEAENGQIALDSARQTPPDLIVLDYNMPVMNGLEMLVAMRADPQLKRTKVIMLTANSNPETIAAVGRLGVRDYITKPFESETLVTKAARLVPLVPKTEELATAPGDIAPPAELPLSTF